MSEVQTNQENMTYLNVFKELRLVCKEFSLANWDASFVVAEVVYSPWTIDEYIRKKYKKVFSLFTTLHWMAIVTHEYYVTTRVKDMTIIDLNHICNMLN